MPTSTHLRNNETRTRIAVAWALVAVASGTSGCRTLDRFRLQSNETYCGSMVSAPVFQEGLLPAPPREPALRLRLDLDVDDLTERPGPISTDDTGAAADPDHAGLCAPRALFDKAPLRAIPEVMHDAISMMQFGDGRDLNFFAWVDSSCQGTMLSVVSLMSDGSVEMRLLKPAKLPPPDAGPEARPGFGLFQLKRTDRKSCNF